MIVTFQLDSIHQNVSEFVQKLYCILQKSDYSQIICWTGDNQIFIKDSKKMEKIILKQYFRHNKMESFVRQLNMYGFSKLNKAQKEKNQMHFKNQNFQMNRIQLLSSIKRKRKVVKKNYQAKIQDESTALNLTVEEVKKNIRVKTDIITGVLSQIQNKTRISNTQFAKIYEVLNILNLSDPEEFPLKEYELTNSEDLTIKEFFAHPDEDPCRFYSKCSLDNMLQR